MRPSLIATLAAVMLVCALPQLAQGAGVGSQLAATSRDWYIRQDGNGTTSDPNAGSLVLVQEFAGAPPAYPTLTKATNLGGSVHRDSDIGVTTLAGTRHVVVRGEDNMLRHWDGNGWISLGDNITGGPAIARLGAAELVVAYRKSDGRIAIRKWGASTGWSFPVSLSTQAKAGTGPSLANGGLGQVLLGVIDPVNSNVRVRTLPPNRDPAIDASWSSLYTLAPTSLVFDSTPRLHPVGQDSFRVWVRGAANRGLYTAAPGASSWTSTSGVIASSQATARPGESTLASSPGSVDRGDTMMVATRADDGCLYTRQTATSVSQTRIGTYGQVSGFSYSGGRCTWPARRQKALPLVRRNSGSDDGALQQANTVWNEGTGNAESQRLFNRRFDTLVLQDGPDWATSFAPRNWHMDGWVYRKSTAYGDELGLHTAPATAGNFVRLTNGQLAAVNYDCNSQSHPNGCSQALLDVTKVAAQNYWLYGADGLLPTSPPTNCSDFAAHASDGILDELACGYEGAWLDDVLADLRTSSNTASASHIANFTTGAPITNGNLASSLPFSLAAWKVGMREMLERLRAGITTLRDTGVIRRWDGTVAINYKWHSFGFAEAATGTPTISPTSDEGRIIKAADLVELEEGWVDGGISPGGLTTDFSWRRRQAFIDIVHDSLGRNVLEEKTNSADLYSGVPSCRITSVPGPWAPLDFWTFHYISAQYNTAMALIHQKPGDRIGDMCERADQAWNGYSDVDPGSPTGPRVESGGVLSRTFQNATAYAVPPGGASVTLNFPTPVKWRKNGANTEEVTSSITLHATFGAIVRPAS